jgi:hypothetical protein
LSTAVSRCDLNRLSMLFIWSCICTIAAWWNYHSYLQHINTQADFIVHKINSFPNILHILLKQIKYNRDELNFNKQKTNSKKFEPIC